MLETGLFVTVEKTDQLLAAFPKEVWRSSSEFRLMVGALRETRRSKKMWRSIGRWGLRWSALGMACLVASATALADDPAAPPQVPAQEPLGGNNNLPQPTIPQPTTPAATAVPLSREAQLEARVQQLEAIVNQLSYAGGE